MAKARATTDGVGGDEGWTAAGVRSDRSDQAGNEVLVTPKPWIDAIAPYHGGESRLPGHDRVLKLSSNENPLGPSPRAVDAYRRAADNLGIYPDGSASVLREALAGAHGLDPEKIVCGAGSDELIALLCQAFCGPEDEIVHTQYAFSMYRIAARCQGARSVAADERELTADPEAILAAVGPKTKIVFLANPNNPTGTYLGRDALLSLAERLPSRVLLVIDGAYAEYMRRADYEPGFALTERFENVVVTRTFSKIYGLAALRLGWLYGPPTVVGALNKLRGPFNISGPALAAGEAAARDEDYAESCAIQNEVWRAWLTKELRDCGVETPDSYANFILPNFGETGSLSAAAADGYLRAQGVIVRRMESYGLPGRLRITIGSAGDNQTVARVLREFMAEAGRDGSARLS